MNLSQLGEVLISVKPNGKGDLMDVRVVCANRKEDIRAVTAPFESVDQFVKRIKGMLSAMYNAEPRNAAPVTLPEADKPTTWQEIKDGLKDAVGIKK